MLIGNNARLTILLETVEDFSISTVAVSVAVGQ
jgi:hypothetical protein